jgi:hypothetical protein
MKVNVKKQDLVNSEMAYPLKINYHTRGIQAIPCLEYRAPVTNEIIFEACKISGPHNFEKCLAKCGTVQGDYKPFSIDVSYLSEKQLKLYFDLRPQHLILHDLDQHPENIEILMKQKHPKALDILEKYYKYPKLEKIIA